MLVPGFTKYIQANKAMGLVEASLQLFQSTFEQAAVGISHVSLTGQFIRLNQKFCEIIGYTHDELMHLTFQEITHPEDLEADLEYWLQLLTGVSDIYDREKRYCRKDGTIVWVKLTVSLVRQANGEPHYFISVIDDISDRKQLERDYHKVIEALAKTHALYNNLLSNISDAVFLTDDTGRFTYVCPNVSTIFSLSKAQIEARGTIQEILGHEFISAIDLNLLKARGEITNQECRIWDVTGCPHDLLVNIKAVQLAQGSVLYTCRDVTDRKQAQEELQLYEKIANTTQDLMAFVDGNYYYRMINDAYAWRFGRPKATILGLTVADLMGPATFQHFAKPKLDECLAGADVRYQQSLKFIDGQEHYLDLAYTPYRDANNRITGVVVSARDITDLHQAEQLLSLEARRAEALLALPTAADKFNEQEFLQYGQELAESLTDSKIAFIHFVNDDEQTIELVAWSRRTLEHYCQAAFDTHYPVAKAGIWADALRQRQPVIFNNYDQYPHKRGLPQGHAVLTRLISVPVIADGKVVMLTGVGNKPTDYTALDVETVQLLANEMWRIAQMKRTFAQLATLNQELEQRVEDRTQALTEEILQREASELRYREVVGKLSDGIAILKVVDEGDDFILREFNAAAEHLFDRSWGEIIGQYITKALPGFQAIGLKAVCQRVWQNGQPEYFPLVEYQDAHVGFWMENYIFRLSEQELAMVFQDVSARKQAEQNLEHIAYYDALTGLPNRMLLIERLSKAMAEAVQHRKKLAVIYLDLDGFKDVNDTYGHDMGDYLLRAIAQRMQHCLRQKDTLARLGGDEFVAILGDLDNHSTDELIVNRLLMAAAQPIQIGDIAIRVSASLGISLYPQASSMNADQLLNQADQAMYQAKLAGKNGYCFFNPAIDHTQDQDQGML
jgi:diguanylate cyclase (GGDEF)-like protein/PAS domain S-box-containing protein